VLSAGPLASNVPLPAASVDKVINPSNRPAYSGPTGAVEGLVRVKGDPPPAQEYRYTPGCEGARHTYERAFREGPGRVVADALVAVTEYDGFLPAKEPAVKVEVKDCAYDRRTIAMMFGQRLEVSNQDEKLSYVPYLANVAAPAHMVLPPKNLGDPVKLYPLDIGVFQMLDEMNRPWMKADIFVLKYPTATVTGLGGRYRLEGIPVGKVKVSAFLPAADATHNLDATITEGGTAKVDFELTYKQPQPAPPASGPARTAPAAK
jgi:hypothetical protein